MLLLTAMCRVQENGYTKEEMKVRLGLRLRCWGRLAGVGFGLGLTLVPGLPLLPGLVA